MAANINEGSSRERSLQKQNQQPGQRIMRNRYNCFLTENPLQEQERERETAQDSKTSNDAVVECQDTSSSTSNSTSLDYSRRIDIASRGCQETKVFFLRQASLQAEARMALAQVRPMVHMQVEVEKQLKKKSPISEIVSIPGFRGGKQQEFGRHTLQQMNIAQLQIVVNDLHEQIETYNEELVKLLVETDELQMAQDSVLVDIEDLTRHSADPLGRLP